MIDASIALYSRSKSNSLQCPDDFVTANVASGVGGVDALIGFETLRPENVGTAMNDSLSFFQVFINDKVSSVSSPTRRAF